MALNENGDESATTRSSISAGTINVANQGAQTQAIAGLSRDTINTNGTVAKTPDVNAILNQQADTMLAGQAAGQTVSQGIGAYADMKRDDAAAADKAATNVATVTAWPQRQPNTTTGRKAVIHAPSCMSRAVRLSAVPVAAARSAPLAAWRARVSRQRWPVR
ncbi:hypothetical protein [Paraburkholderia bannensis]|uniref:hypothetical protein n=1 Tax=Paraburkholderia bannensis TaxID=765414 RepID=UPI002AC33A96|nr:hypothetical protein [Paraburkholderia bannensis]